MVFRPFRAASLAAFLSRMGAEQSQSAFELEPLRGSGLTLAGTIGSSMRIDYINQFGPIDAWVTLATVTLTNTSQLYFDISAPYQPPRLWRIVPVP
jgi:hypothetical protein